MRFTLYSCLIGCLFFTACTTKETVYETEHVNVIIDDNTPPPYDQVTTVQIQNYINKMYIDLLGREPLNVELTADTEWLKGNNLSAAARNQIFDQLMEQEAYFDRLQETYAAAYLNQADEVDINEQKFTFIFLINQAEQTGDYAVIPYYQQEVDRLDALLNAADDYGAGTIGISAFMQRLCINNIYDQVNMGSENFVLSCFENFLKRFPTENELEAGVSMVDGFSAQILLQDGNSKQDFVTIITTDLGFYEGLTVDIYQQLLARRPNSAEMVAATEFLAQNGDYQGFQRQLLATEEYAGF